ncbi:hypothetical protein HHI36_002742 [Cryptolaemus montrouzieri]|uniref:Uncharacterized protein n=1 Tax=Cryptolaemus montrouzieri TaxID=559131 RepID=A0ABD2PBV0_9CUCU
MEQLNFSTTKHLLPKVNGMCYKNPPTNYTRNINLCIPWKKSTKPASAILTNTSSRKLHLNHRRTQIPKTPDLIYFPHVMRWLKTKLRFKYLKRTWDPTFSEGAFIYGSTHAVCRITEIINNNRMEELEGLLTAKAKIKLVEDISTKLTRTQREIIRISPRDIKILVPMSVNLKNDGLEKHCKISMRVLALKWHPQRTGFHRLVLVALQSEFMKDYLNGIDQDWNISGFDVMECTVLTEVPSNNL